MALRASVKLKAGTTRKDNKATTYKVFQNSGLQTVTMFTSDTKNINL